MNRIALMGFCFTSLLLSGCVKYYELSTTEFPQGSSAPSQATLKKRFVRSLKLYNQFETIAAFDVLWLSPEVRSNYAQRFCAKRGKDADALKAIESRQIEETNHWIEFYILSDIRKRGHGSLKEKNAAWTVHLTINNKVTLESMSIKEVELEAEYQTIFGHLYNSFKNIYLVKFPAYGLDGKQYITTPHPTIKLTIAGPEREGSLVWDKASCTQKLEINNDEDFYWS